MAKLLYSQIMNRWLYGGDIDKLNQKKSLVFKDGYDDPTYMTFKVEFGDWGASILDKSLRNTSSIGFGIQNDYDALPIGLLNCPYDGAPDQESYWQNNANTDAKVFNGTRFYSAFQYLRSRNEDTRAKYLYYFVNGLYEIQHDYPFIFKKISGVNSLESFNPKDGQRLMTPGKIVLECFEGLDLKIRTLFEFYRKAAWDDVYQRWILPENMREFKMIIYVFERRIFQDTKMVNVNVGGTQQKHMIMGYSDLNADIPVKAYECCPCEFDIKESISWGSEYDAGWVGNNEETSKICIQVKNVKTYFKNGLLNDTLSKSYDNNGKSAGLFNDLTQKIDSIMIYDLVDNIERSNENVYDTEGTTSASAYSNLTVNGAKALFLNKNILLENEEAKEDIREYVWGHSAGGPTSKSTYAHAINNDHYLALDDSGSNQLFDIFNNNPQETPSKTYAELVKETAFYSMLEDNEWYRGGWGFAGQAPTYDANKSFWSNLGDNIKNLFTGSRRLILLSGSSTIHLIDNCLFDSFYTPEYPYEPISNYNNGFGKMRIRETKLTNSPKPENPINEFNPEIRQPQTQQYTELNSREVQQQNFNELQDSRQIPDQEFSEQTSRQIPDQDYMELEKERMIYSQNFNDLEQAREIKEQEFGKIEQERFPDKQHFKELEPEREQIKQKFEDIAKERSISEQTYKDLEKTRVPDTELIELLLTARSLPGFKDITLDEIRKLPKQDLLDLKNAKDRSMPEFIVDKSVLLETIKDIEGTNMKLMELDKDNKTLENQTLELLKKNKALPEFKITNTQDKFEEEKKIKKLKNITLFTKEFAEKSDNVKKAYVSSILEMKDQLKKSTIAIINNLPTHDTYIVKNGETDNNNVNSALVSQNDIDQINENMAFLSINDNDMNKLSFQTLISIQENLADALERTQAVVGLTGIAQNSVATTRNKIKNPNQSVLEEPTKRKINVIY